MKGCRTEGQQLQKCQWDLHVLLQPQRGTFSLQLGRACRSRRWDEDIKWQHKDLETSDFPPHLMSPSHSVFWEYIHFLLLQNKGAWYPQRSTQTWRGGQVQRWLYILGGYLRSSFDSDESHCQWLLGQLCQKKCSRVRTGEDLCR